MRFHGPGCDEHGEVAFPSHARFGAYHAVSYRCERGRNAVCRTAGSVDSDSEAFGCDGSVAKQDGFKLA